MPKKPKPPIKNMGASVRARLLNLSKQRRQPFDLLLNNYVLERLLYRLSQTKHHDRFILKGAILLTKWFEDPLRPTRDLDFLAIGNDDQEEMVRIFQEVSAVHFNDGVVIDPDSVKVDRIREETEYGGLRITANAMIDNAKIRVVIDIAFGDSVEPGLQEMDLPVLLDFPAPHLRAYARETVIAEKFQAMVMLGRANSRMKDLYDVWVLSRNFEFKDGKLPRAIAATFARRKTEIPSEIPDALTTAFAEDPTKVQQWNSFSVDVAFRPGTLADVVKDLSAFLVPHASAARSLGETRSA
ncbi:nucleotidyl transferase AbiEii/AbiGii toxin family protein (plasmid) [Bradyrhizobium sp. CB82]|uniref:nucleotidyl transferase AbiEii/AbiGii toxin family protein n=1 Tax=Bradyrhizobium sp. CB82 TaxID=3039159 RepID=UPI0024B1E04C|nr:nucleotidyl transferase AbiEii/AbiGii toxin family protein [Bradyrhizobium sp. CB82]WFU45821.1 nucleotidyl transferase AbiEii/AbiGii toxin family protein [Bradyrhizobium sp. CB82]